MSHPFTSQRKALVIYSMVWIFIALIDAIFLRFSLEFPISISVSEAFFGSVLFGLLGLIIWYPIRYIPFRKEAPIYSISAHVAVAMIVLLTWLVITVSLLGVVFSGDEEYQNYLTSSLLFRGVVGSMLYLVMVLIYYLVSYARTLRERAQAEAELRTLIKESELNLLKSQINPHFLFNSLNSISSLIMTNPEKAQDMIIRLSDFLRYSLKHRENEFVTIDEEIGRMKDYLLIEQIRFGEKLKYNISTSDQCTKQLVPTMIMQPLIENAIKHGVYESIEPVSVEFSCEVNNGFLELELWNDFDPETPSRPGTGLGLQNVSERIRLAYDDKGSIIKRIENGVFRVILLIPIVKES